MFSHLWSLYVIEAQSVCNGTCFKSQCPSPVSALQCSRPLPVSLLYFPAGWLCMGGRADLKLLAQTAHSPARPLMSCFHCFSFAGTMTRTFRHSGHNVLVAFVGSVFLLHTTGEFSWLAQTYSYPTRLTYLASLLFITRAFTTSSHPQSAFHEALWCQFQACESGLFKGVLYLCFSHHRSWVAHHGSIQASGPPSPCSRYSFVWISGAAPLHIL